MRRLGQLLGGALRNQSGAVLFLTALTTPMILIVVGFAADYAYASYLNQRLARACDTAALSAVSQSAATSAGGYGNTAALKTYGTNVFTENTRDVSLANKGFSLSVTQDSSSFAVTAIATYSAVAPTFFSGLLGLNSIPLSNSIQSTAQPPTYINYYLLVDTSNSMGIGATQSDMATLYNALNAKGFSQNGEKGCVFACHDANIGSNYTYTTEQVARTAGVTLRIDSAVSAIQSIINSAASIAGTTKNIQFGIYLLQDNPNTGKFITALVDPPSNNYASLGTSAGTIDLGSNSGRNTMGDTDYQNELSTFNASYLPANGTGASAASPLNYVFLVTDGVGDQIGTNCSSSTCTFTMNASWCSAIKAKATLGIIYTTYLPIYNNNNSSAGYELLYNSYVAPIQSQISPNLQSCATSSDYFFEASDGPSITTTMQALFAKTQPVSARLTR